MDQVNISVKIDHVSRYNAETTITVKLMKFALTLIICATKSNAKVTLCVKIKHYLVKLTPSTVPLVNASALNTLVKFLNVEPINTVTPLLVIFVTPM